MKIAGLQFDIAWENPTKNFDRIRSFAKGAAIDGVELLVLPEMFSTGFSMNAEKIAGHGAETRQFLKDLAIDHHLHVLGGFAEEQCGSHYNTCSIFDSSGVERLHFRKIHPFSLAGEDEHYSSGNHIETVSLGGLRITPFICYDLRFPEIFRACVDDTDLFCVLANWPARRRHAWQSLLVARAIENQAFVLGVNRVGVGQGQEHSGDSMLVDPMGEILDSATDCEFLIQGTITPEQIREVRERFSFVADRRPALYSSFDQKY